MMTNREKASKAASIAMLSATILAAACSRNPQPVARPAPPPPAAAPGATSRAPTPPVPVAEPTIVPPEPIKDDRIASASLDELNKNSPFKPVFFEYNSSEITSAGRTILDDNAAVLKKSGTWIVTIEGHCDERGSAEYNLALGERRAVSVRTYLVSLGIPADRLRTVSYGKEFPFDPGHDEAAWAKNRRAHFVITGR
jgi:peptidoglycan-associated lipoprotein